MAPVHTAKQEITVAGQFLAWLQATGRTLEACTPGDVDVWLAGGPTTRSMMRTVLVWCVEERLAPPQAVRIRQARTTPVLTGQQRLEWLRTLLVDDVDTLACRVAGVLLLLYAQQLTRIAQLRVQDVIDADEQIFVRFSEDPTPVPEPFAAMLRTHLANRPNRNTTNAASDWLFPGYRAGQPLHRDVIMRRLRRLGVDLLSARNAALRSLVQEVPAPVVARMLGYWDKVTQRHAEQAGTKFARYVNLPG